ncbi:MAG: LptF/LptG family permease [Candidatus Gastranaerophilales bacterium]|nr:LptF/LptG family permease [Candidatus Gastranaerophilales bacterium]
MERFKILDKYITKQLIETFLLGIIIFTSIMFASDTFINLVKQITSFGISGKVALLVVLLKLPSILVLTIPMGVLLATILTINKLCLNSEVTIFRACGISIARLSLPVFIFGIAAAITCFFINELIVPAANVQARNLTMLALTQKSVPDGRSNFSFEQLNENGQVKRLFYIDKCYNGRLHGITALDMSKRDAVTIIQSKYGSTNPDYWNFDQGVSYTLTQSGKIKSSIFFDRMQLFTNFNTSGKMKNRKAKEFNFYNLIKYIEYQKKKGNIDVASLLIQLHEKFAIPVTSFLIAIIGIPLAITPPRAKFNRGFLFSILILFCYYLLRAFSISLGESQILDPFLSAWLPNIVIAFIGGLLFYRKAFLI